MIKLKSLLTERLVYHGTISDFVDKIKTSKKLISVLAGAQKVSGGLTTEPGLIWVTPDMSVADLYAKGVESAHEYNFDKGLKARFGGIFTLEIPDNLRLIDRYTPLTPEERDILNAKFIPDYKPLQDKDSLSNAEWRIHSGTKLHDLLVVLGYDGVTMGKGKQIGLVASELPVKAFIGRNKEPVPLSA